MSVEIGVYMRTEALFEPPFNNAYMDSSRK